MMMLRLLAGCGLAALAALHASPTLATDRGNVGFHGLTVDEELRLPWCPSGYLRAVGSSAPMTCAPSVPAGDISGLAPSATTDTTNASNIGSGILSVMRLPPFVQSGAGALSRPPYLELGTSYNATQFAACDGVADDQMGFAQALANIASTTGTLRIPRNTTCRVSGQLIVPFGVSIIGEDDQSSVLSAIGVTRPSFIKITAGLSSVRNLKIVNADPAAVLNAIEIVKTPVLPSPIDGLPIEVSNNNISQFKTPVSISYGDNISVIFNWFVNNTSYGIDTVDVGMNSRFNWNYFQGNPGIHLGEITKAAEGTEIAGNKFVLGNSYPCVHVEAALNLSIHDNMCDQVVGGPGLWIDGAAGHPLIGITSRNNWWGSNGVAGTGVPAGIFLDAGASNGISGFVSDSDTFVHWAEGGIYSRGRATAYNEHIRIINPITIAGALSSNGKDIQLAYTSDCAIQGPIFSGTASLVANTGTFCTVDRGFWNVAPSGADISGLKFGRQVSGLAVINFGSVTIASGTTTVNITHGLWAAPTPAQIQFVPINAPTNPPGVAYISTCNAFACAINVPTDPGASGASYSWKADLTQ